MVQKNVTNGTSKYRDQQNNMSFQRKDSAEIKGANSGKGDGRMQNGKLEI